jgi:hypothetical protein
MMRSLEGIHIHVELLLAVPYVFGTSRVYSPYNQRFLISIRPVKCWALAPYITCRDIPSVTPPF